MNPSLGLDDRQPLQPKLENTKINKSLGSLDGTVKAFALALSSAVEEARKMIFTKSFVHVPAVDGYMANFLGNFDVNKNTFVDGKAVPRQAGYWIESYATKIVAPSASGLDVILQATRGHSRPDVVLQYKGTDIAWLDITSGASEGHIYDKDSLGWLGTPYVTEVTYEPLKVLDLNKVSVPDKSNLGNLEALLERANAARKKQLEWEAAIIEKYGFGFATLMQDGLYYVKKSAVKHDTEMDLDGESFDKFYSPNVPGNKYEKLALSFIQERTKRTLDARDLTAVVMYWQGMVKRYETIFQKQLPKEFYLPPKASFGLDWVRDVSSADGEPLIRELFPV